MLGYLIQAYFIDKDCGEDLVNVRTDEVKKTEELHRKELR